MDNETTTNKAYKVYMITFEEKYKYIGLTKRDVDTRIFEHFRFNKHSNWVIVYITQNTNIRDAKIELLKNNMSQQEAKYYELQTIKHYYKEQRHFLLNIYAGGKHLGDSYGALLKEEHQQKKHYKYWSKPDKMRVLAARQSFIDRGYRPLCPKCGEFKDMEQFTVDTNKSRGHRAWCKQCDHNRYKKHANIVKAYNRREYPNRYEDYPVKEQKCTKCNKTKPSTEFNWYNTRETPLGYHCKPCSNGYKQCFKCKKYKSPSKFYKRKRSKDGLQSNCIECSKVEKRAYLVASRGEKGYPRLPDHVLVKCAKCSLIKPAKEYNASKACKNGLSSYCKVCTYQYLVARRAEHQQRLLAIKAKYKYPKRVHKRVPNLTLVKCRICLETKYAKEFHSDFKMANGIANYCKKCNNDRVKNVIEICPDNTT